MSDSEPLIPADSEEEFLDIVRDILRDPESRGFTMSAVGPDLGAVAQTVSDGEYETHVALCAILLREHVEGLEAEPTGFIKDVVDEFNERDITEEYRR